MGSTILCGSPNPTNFPNTSPRRRNGSPFRRRDGSAEPRVPANNQIMGKVKILKRGEPLTAFLGSKASGIAADKGDLDLGLCSTRRLGPDPVPVLVRKQVRFSDEGHAGSAVFLESPPPSSVPVPCFLGKTAAASTDLRRLLRLNLP